MKIAIIYNKDLSGVINTFGMQNKETYDPQTVQRVAAALEKAGHNVSVFDGNMHIIERIQEFMPRVIHQEKMGMVFNMAYGIQGESRYTHIPSMLEMLGIPYVGSSPSGHALALDKVITKVIMQKHDLPTPDFWVFSSEQEDMSTVKFPVIVKPKMESVSFGLRVVHNVDDLREAVAFIIEEFKQQALVEQFIRGREFAVGVLGNNPVETFPVLEIDLGNDPDAIQTVGDKKEKPRRKVCPANISEELARQMQELSLKAFKSLQLRDFARVDIRLDENNRIYLLEINSMASLGASGSYVRAAKEAGYDFDALVQRMLDVAVVRYFSEQAQAPAEQQKRGGNSLPVRMRSFMRSRSEQNEKLLQRLVDLNTYVRNKEGVDKAGLLVNRALKSLGFDQEVVHNVEIGNSLFFSNHPGKEMDVLFLGYLDNDVRSGNHEYFRTREQKLYGTGIWENKGGIVVLIQALQALRFARKLSRIKIGVLLTSDNTLHNPFTRNNIAELSGRAKVLIGLSGAGLSGSIITSRSGGAVYRWSATTKKDQDTFMLGTAMNNISKALSKLSALSNDEKGVLVLPTRLNIKSDINHPWLHAETTVSVRYSEEQNFAGLGNMIHKILHDKKLKGLTLSFDGGKTRPPMLSNEKSGKLYQLIRTKARELDIYVEEEQRWSSGSVGFAQRDVTVLDGFGPVGKASEEGGNYILRHSLSEKSILLATMLLDYEEWK